MPKSLSEEVVSKWWKYQAVLSGSNDVSVLAGVLDELDVFSRQLRKKSNLLDGVIGCVQLSDATDYTGINVHGGILVLKVEERYSVVEGTIRIKNMKYRASKDMSFFFCCVLKKSAP